MDSNASHSPITKTSAFPIMNIIVHLILESNLVDIILLTARGSYDSCTGLYMIIEQHTVLLRGFGEVLRTALPETTAKCLRSRRWTKRPSPRMSETRTQQSYTSCTSNHGTYGMIIVRFTCPPESRPHLIPSSLHSTAAPDTSGSMNSFMHHHPKLLSTLFSSFIRTMRYIFLYVKSGFLFPLFSIWRTDTGTPDPCIKPMIEARTKDEQMYYTFKALPKKVAHAIALVANEASDARNQRVVKLIEMRARHKRVKEIMRAKGCHIDEDMYQTEIRAALRKLRK